MLQILHTEIPTRSSRTTTRFWCPATRRRKGSNLPRNDGASMILAQRYGSQEILGTIVVVVPEENDVWLSGCWSCTC